MPTKANLPLSQLTPKDIIAYPLEYGKDDFMLATNKFVNEVICAMAVALNNVQLKMLENVLLDKLHGKTIEEECTELSTYCDDNDYMLQVFAANKKLENLSDKSIEQYVRTTRNMLLTLNKNYKDVTTEDIKYYLAMYQKQNKVGSNTLSNMKRFVSAFYTWAEEEDYITKNPTRKIKNIKQVQKEKEYLNNDEIEAIRLACETKRERALVELLLSIGGRVSEIAALNISDIDFKDESVSIYGQKTRTYRTGYLTASARLHVRNYIMSRTDENEALFVATKGAHARLGNSSLQNEIQVVAKRAGIKKHVTVHLFRKTFATRLSAAGVRIEIIKELLGHADISVTEKNYVTVNAEDVRIAHRRGAA